MNRLMAIGCAAGALVALLGFSGSALADDGRGENLIKNADFAQPLAKPWGVVPGVVRKETEALSGDWMLSALGKNYFIISYMDDTLPWKEGEQFTIVIDARSRGKGSNLAIIHRYDKFDGALGEGTYRRLELSNEWHEYYVPMTATKGGRPRGFSFFKVDSGEHDTGVEIRSFKMYRGKISSLDIRRIVRAGRAYVEKGTEIPVATNLYGLAARPFKALVFVNDISAIREAQHLFAGTGATAHFLSASSKASDTFLTDDDPAEILRLLKSGGYDLYAFGRNTAPNVGEEVFKLVEANVMKGASAYFQPLWDVPKPDFALFGDMVAAGLKGVPYGKGRVTAGMVRRTPEDERLYNRWRAFMTYPCALTERLGYEDFPYEQILFTELFETMSRAAFGPVALPSDATTTRREETYAGERHVCEWIRTAEGKTLSFRHTVAPADGPVIGAVTDTGTTVEVVLSNAAVSTALKWGFKVFSGRLFGEGTAKGPVAVLKVPREKLYTSYGLLELTLVDRGRILDRRNAPVIERDNDRLRMIGDYGAGFWPMKGGYTYVDARDMFLQLKSIGLNYSFMPHAWGTVYPTGLAATSSYVIGGEYFGGSPSAKDNIRTPVFNTPEARRRIREKALGWAKANRQWGGMYGSFSDEARLAPDGMEVDAHPENLKVYRTWMERKYGTIAEYNRRHRTHHASFADLGQTLLKDARAATNAAEFIEWRNFNVDRWVEVIREVGDAITEVDPAVLYSFDNSFGEMALSGNDYWKLLTQAGFTYSKEYTSCTSFGRNPFQEFDAFYRSWRPDMRVWGWTGYGFTSDREKALPWMTALHRQGGFHWFAATYYGINLLDLVTGAKTTDATECEKMLADTRILRGLGKTLTDWKWTKNDVAVYYSHDSNIMTFFLGRETNCRDCFADTPYWKFQHSRRGVMTLLESLFCQYEFVSQEQVEKGFLDGGDWSVYRAGKVIEGQPPFKVLFMTQIVAMSDREVAAVKAFLKRGGKVVCDILPGAYDELGVKRAKAPFDAQEMTVTGKVFDDLDADQRAWALSFLHKTGATFAIESPTVEKNLCREGVHYRDGGADLYGVIRKPYHGSTAESSDRDVDELVFARAGHVYDVRAQKYLGHGDRVKAQVPFAEAEVYAVLSAKIDGIGIAGLSKSVWKFGGAKRGTTLSVDLQIRSADVTPAYVLHVDLVSPTGQCPTHFQRNLATEAGKAHVDFPLALNDETGVWTLRVSEPLTGIAAEQTFTVRD